MAKNTQAVHSGTRRESGGGLNTPLDANTAYPYLDSGVRYPRYFNTTNQDAVVEKLCALEGAEAGLLMASGMAAISTAFLAHCRSGDTVLVQQGIYGGTEHLARTVLPQFGLQVARGPADTEGLLACIHADLAMVHVETPTNPRLRIIDLERIAAACTQAGAIMLVDNTFASPALQNPLRHGADLVMHSATKYLGGHSDLCAGVVLGGKALIDPLRELAINLGGSLGARDAWLLERSIKTLNVRVERQSANAMAIAEYLAGHDAIESVDYPGLPGHPGHDTASKQMNAFGGMLSFTVKPPLTAQRVEQSLGLIASAVSLGGVESTVCQPILTSHAKVTPEEREAQGVTDRLLRMSVGIEDVEDLIGDLEGALEHTQG